MTATATRGLRTELLQIPGSGGRGGKLFRDDRRLRFLLGLDLHTLLFDELGENLFVDGPARLVFGGAPQEFAQPFARRRHHRQAGQILKEPAHLFGEQNLPRRRLLEKTKRLAAGRLARAPFRSMNQDRNRCGLESVCFR
jgi:hypothetical protein